MKLPSIAQAVEDARNAFMRFPFVLVVALLGTIAALTLIEREGLPLPSFLTPVFFAAVLGIPFLTAIALTAERKTWSRPVKLGLQCGGVVLLAAYALTVPRELDGVPFIHVIRLLILSVALHLAVAVGPYVGNGSSEGFWHYNKTLFLRVLTGALYTFVLWVGLMVALAALDNLFGVNIPPKRYGELWVVLVGLFHTWFFLAGLPEKFDDLETAAAYPKELKIFAQYILFPLVLVYLGILYVYGAKILVTWNWPEGWVSKLILGFAGTGMFSLLLMHPISSRTENIWIRNASRWFYLVMIPLVVLLFFAVLRRVGEYGITEGRYLAIVLATWLSVVVLYFVVSKTKSIRFIPLSLCVTAFLVSFGPWGVFSVSEQSQIGRLRALLTKNAMLVDGRIQKGGHEISFEDRKQISSIVAYLQMFHGLDAIQPWFDQSLRLESADWKFKDPASVTKLMGIEYTRAWQSGNSGFVILTADPRRGIDVNGYEHMMHTRQYDSRGREKLVRGEEFGYRVSNDLSGATFLLFRNGEAVDSLQIAFGPALADMVKEVAGGNNDEIPPGKMTITGETASFRVKLFFWQVNIQRKGDENRVNFFDADVFYSINPGK